jgi:hypothetical protein
MGWFDGITSIFKGGGIVGGLVKTVAMGYVVNKLSASSTKGNNSGSSISSTDMNAPGIDNGVRLQVNPAPDEKIPVLYGSAFFGGVISEAVMSNNNQRMTYVLTLAEKTGNLYSSSSATSYTFDSILWDDQLVYFKADGVTVDYTVDRAGSRDESLRDLVKIYCYAGNSSSTSQKFPTGYSGTAVNAYSLIPGWTSGYAMSNLIFAVIEVNYSAAYNVKGIGDVTFQVSSSMYKPGDVLYDYMTNSVFGANIAVAEIDTATITALNSYSANSVTYTDETGSHTLTNRYQINGLVNTDNEVMRNVEEIANSAGSWLSYSVLTGKWGVIINRSGSSSIVFDDSNILGGISISGTGLKDLYNSVKTEFTNRDIRDTTDYVQVVLPNNLRNANEQDNTLNIAYNLINEPVQAQLLGFIELKQSRIDKVITFQSDYTTIGLTAGELIKVTNSKLGFNEKLFRVISVAEVSGDEGLQSEITALEYDSTVYDEDLSRYTRVLSNGLITVGNIGIPSTPTITKYEAAARPRIEISTTAPTGVIEGLEYWLSNDVGVGDAQRSYRLIATKVPTNGNANVRGTFISGTTVSLDYDTIGTSNLVVKTRAYNSTTVGPFSSNSAITSFTAQQTTDLIGPNTQAVNELGGLMTALSVVSLLNNLDGLFGNNAASAGGLFEKIFDVFKDETGYDIVGETAGGNLTVSSQLGIKDEGTLLTNAASTINFVGTGATTTVSNISEITVTLNDSFGTISSNSGISSTTVAEAATASSAKLAFESAPVQLGWKTSFAPCFFGSSDTLGLVDTRYGIYTAWQLSQGTVLASTPGYVPPAVVSSGQYNFLIDLIGTALDANMPSLKVFSQGQPLSTSPNPNWSNSFVIEDSPNLNDYPGKIWCYYAICTYDGSKTLLEQDWGNWNYLYESSGNGLSFSAASTPNTTVASTYGSGSLGLPGMRDHWYSTTNPIQGRYQIATFGSPGPVSAAPICPLTQQFGNSPYTAETDTGISSPQAPVGRNLCRIKSKTKLITLGNNQIITFGISNQKFQSGTAFSGNTIVAQMTQPTINNGYNADLNYSFPGYTPITGNTAQIPYKVPFTGTDYVYPTSSTTANITTAVWSQIGILCPYIVIKKLN